jgi:hypothetical protein
MPLVQCSRNSICQAIGVSVEDLLGTFSIYKLVESFTFCLSALVLVTIHGHPSFFLSNL